MLDMLRKLLQPAANGVSPDADAGPERSQVATAVLLLEMAHTDDSLHDLEAELVNRILRERFSLGEEALQELYELAEEQRRESLDLYQFSREINENFSKEEKLEIMTHLWRVVYADGAMDPYEEALARQLATLLRLTHEEMIDAKLRAQQESERRQEPGAKPQ